MTLEIYGYAGCSTVKKARDWADANDLNPVYAHFSAVPDLVRRIAGWAASAGIDAVFNDRSQTFRNLASGEQAAIAASDATKIAAMAADPRLIKRPVGVNGATVLTGFRQSEWEAAFA
ncbi:MAG: ArsC/Spx/MgsR family protein [Oricola sp.]